MLEIPEWVVKEMHAHVAREYPDEATGAVLMARGPAPGHWKYRVVPMRNGARDPRQNYSWSRGQTMALFRDMDRTDSGLLVIYHSHPETMPEPSVVDQESAWFLGAHYVIFSLVGGKDDLWYQSYLCHAPGDLQREEVILL